MTRFIAEHFRPDGKPKKAYRTEIEAALAADDCGKDYYVCAFCGHFHIGGKP